MAKKRLDEIQSDVEYGKMMQSVIYLKEWQAEFSKKLDEFIKAFSEKFSHQELIINELLLTQQSKFENWCNAKEKEMDEKIRETTRKADIIWITAKALMWLASASGIIFLIQVILGKYSF